MRVPHEGLDTRPTRTLRAGVAFSFFFFARRPERCGRVPHFRPLERARASG